MLTRLREIVEKVAAAASLTDALDLLVNETCLAMDTEVCSIYLADNDRRCYYLMATRGLKKPRGRTIALAFDEGVVGLVGRRAEPINLADAQSHPSFKYVPQVKRGSFPILPRGADHSSAPAAGRAGGAAARAAPVRRKRRVFHGHPATQMAGILSQSQLNAIFGQYRQTRVRAGGLARRGGGGRVAGQQPAFTRSGLPRVDAGHRQRARAPDAGAGRGRRGVSPLQQAFCRQLAKESAAIFDLYSHLLNDARLKRELFAEIDNGSVAEWAVKQVIETFAEQFAKLQDTYMRERGSDLRALGQRLLFHLDDTTQGATQWPARFVLVADELTATLLAEVPQDRLVGVVVRDGAANSHAAILVRAMGVPTVMGADIQPSLLSQRLLIVDGYRGELLVDPEPVLVQEYQRLISEELELSKLAEDDVEQPAQLKSGERIQVMLNAGLSPEHEQLLGGRVDGVGLYRTEIPFMLQSGFPPKRNRSRSTGHAAALPEQAGHAAHLDIGADKQLPYMPISEENPCLAGAASASPWISRRSFDSGARDAARQRRHRQSGHSAADDHQPGRGRRGQTPD